jgi:hypothetical protein
MDNEDEKRGQQGKARNRFEKKTPDELDRELLTRETPDPDDKRFLFPNKEGTPARKGIMTATLKLYTDVSSPDDALSDVDTMELLEALRLGKSSHFRHLYVNYEWMERYQIHDGEIKENARSIAAIVMPEDLVHEKEHCFQLAAMNYGTSFNLCKDEPFYSQPIIAGSICTGFLVKENVVATAAPWVTEKNVTNLRIIFGYQMQNSETPVTTFSHENMFRGVKVLRNTESPENAISWALVKLDRKVKDRAPVRLSGKDVNKGQAIYTIGHPLGLPLKHISGPYILDDTNENHFTANLGLYGSSSGSPVFHMGSDDVVGFVEHVYYPGLRWTGECWVSIANGLSGADYEGVKCTYPRVFADALASF